MTTKNAVLKLLWENADAYVSGAELSRRLSVSRTAVWKAVEQLRGEGYQIRSVTNRGYCLSSDSGVLSEEGIRRTLKSPGVILEVFPSVGSTNTLLKERAAAGAPEGTVILSGAQTAGRGRLGRSFYSPPGTGLYMSLLLRPKLAAAESTDITACAAVAVAEAIEEAAGVPTGIKWVNDVLIRGKKVCGILTEASVDCESGMMNYVVTGIGINLRPPAGDFPEELRAIAGAIFEEDALPDQRCHLAAAVLDRFLGYYRCLSSREYAEGYRKRSVVLGKSIFLLSPGQEPVPARALDIDDDFALLVQLGDGSVKRVNTGEVSIRVAE